MSRIELVTINNNTISINHDFKDVMNSIMMNNEVSNNVRGTIFDESLKLYSINSSVRNKNYYTLDKYGLVIRRDNQNDVKSPFGWCLIDNEPVNIHVGDTILINNVRKTVMQKMKQRWRPQFELKGMLRRAILCLSANIDDVAMLLEQ